jgi:hypothetical protein
MFLLIPTSHAAEKFGKDEFAPFIFLGRRTRDRTWDLGLVRAALFQLSYPPGT